MTISMTTTRTLLAGALLFVTACPGTAGPLPDLPAPEYEAPRAYEPDKAIDSLEGGGDETIPDAPPPAAPATAGETPAPPPAAPEEPSRPEGAAEGEGDAPEVPEASPETEPAPEG